MLERTGVLDYAVHSHTLISNNLHVWTLASASLEDHSWKKRWRMSSQDSISSSAMSVIGATLSLENYDQFALHALLTNKHTFIHVHT